MRRRRPSRFVSERSAWVVILTLLLAMLAVPALQRLRIETDLVSLLPADSPAADDYRRFIETFGGFEKVFVLAVADSEQERPEDGDLAGSLLEATELLADRLRPLGSIAAVRTGVGDEEREWALRYVVRRAPLLWPESAFEAPAVDRLAHSLEPENLRSRVESLRARLHSPAGAATLPLLVRDPLGFSDQLPLGAGNTAALDPLTSAFLSAEGDTALLILDPALGEMDAAGGKQLKADLDRAFEEVRAELARESRGAEALSEDLVAWSSPRVPVRFLALGGPLYAAQDEAAIRRDLELTVTGSIAGCSLILLLAFGGFGVPMVATALLAVALLWTGGALGLGLGTVTAAGFGFAAVLVGLGIDYAIHGSARYRQQRLQGDSPADALAATFHFAGPGITTSALTTAAAFSTLGAAHFRPLRELGLVTAIGIVAILLASATFGSALLLRVSPGRPGRLWRSTERVVARIVALGERHPRSVLAFVLLATLLSLVGIGRLSLDPDLRALRPSDHPVFEAEALLVERFGIGLGTSTLVVSAEDLDAALDAAARVAQVLAETHPEIAISSPTDWLVPRETLETRLSLLAELPFAEAADFLETELPRHNLSPRAFASGLEALRALGTGLDPGAAAPRDWPSGLGELVRVDPAGGAHVALRLRIPDGVWSAGPPAALLARLEREAPGLAAASVPRLGAEMKKLASYDLRSLAWVALVLVGLAVGVSFGGNPAHALLAMAPVFFGSIWAFGLWGALGRDLDLLSLAVVPILLGIGIDDGLHTVHGARASHRARHDSRDEEVRTAAESRGLAAATREAGLAIALTTLTTCVGFGSLASSSIPGLQSGGLLVSSGVAFCLLATLLVLPAIGALGVLGGESGDSEPEDGESRARKG